MVLFIDLLAILPLAEDLLKRGPAKFYVISSWMSHDLVVERVENFQAKWQFKTLSNHLIYHINAAQKQCQSLSIKICEQRGGLICIFTGF